VTADVGPAQLVLTATVARRYYLDGKSKIEIADELKLSRFKVARLLENARSSGLVRIDIGHPGEIDVVLSSELRDAYQLQHAIVVDTLDEHDAGLRQQVGLAAAELLSEIVTTDDVLGLGWARSLMAMRAELTAWPGAGRNPKGFACWPARRRGMFTGKPRGRFATNGFWITEDLRTQSVFQAVRERAT
jgi:DNA-binding transcriptional regulator LsrR (DeoR family)